MGDNEKTKLQTLRDQEQVRKELEMDEVATEMKKAAKAVIVHEYRKKSRSKSTPAPTSEKATRSKPERSTNEEPQNQDAHEVPGEENLPVTSDNRVRSLELALGLAGKGAALTQTNVNCLCLNTHPDPLMLECHLCSYQQHAACYRIISVDNIPSKYCCVTCSIKHGVPCTDAKLVEMSSNPAVAHTCLFRRVLYHLLQVEGITVEVVVERLGVETSTAVAVVQKLGSEGCLEDDEIEDDRWLGVNYAVIYSSGSDSE